MSPAMAIQSEISKSSCHPWEDHARAAMHLNIQLHLDGLKNCKTSTTSGTGMIRFEIAVLNRHKRNEYLFGW
jgi:hypothetical protein